MHQAYYSPANISQAESDQETTPSSTQLSAENPSAAQARPQAIQEKTHQIIAGLEKRLEEMSASNKQNMDDITSESAKGLEKVVELREKRFKANGVDMTTLLKRSEKTT